MTNFHHIKFFCHTNITLCNFLPIYLNFPARKHKLGTGESIRDSNQQAQNFHTTHKAENKTFLNYFSQHFSLAVWFWQFWNIPMSLRQGCSRTRVKKIHHLYLMEVCFLPILEKKSKKPSRIKLLNTFLSITEHKQVLKASASLQILLPLQFSSFL